MSLGKKFICQKGLFTWPFSKQTQYLAVYVSVPWHCHFGDLAKTLTIFNPFPNKPWFLHVCSTSFLKKTAGIGEIALTLSQTTNFRLFQTERVCRQQL